MRLKFCVACGCKDNLQHHHLKPRVVGGTDDETNLITLCQECHAIYHNLNFRDHSYLTRKGLERAKARGVKLGSPLNEQQTKEAKIRAKEYQPTIDNLIASGYTTLYSISKQLNSLCIKTAKGGKWYPQTVKNHFKYLGYTLPDYLELHHSHPTNRSQNQNVTT